MTMLRLNEGQGIHSMYAPDRYVFYGSWMQFMVAPFFNEPGYGVEDINRAAIVGLAAGTSSRQMTEAFGPIPIDGYELDPEIVEVGREYFDMNQENLNVYVEDGRWGLEHSEHLYSLIIVDAYRPPYIPWHMTTKEFFQIVYDHLEEDGTLAINVGRAPEDRRLIEALNATIGEVFPNIYVVDVPHTFNSIMYATKQETNVLNFLHNYDMLLNTPDTKDFLLEAMRTVIYHLQDDPAPGMVFTDDKAPVEGLINDMVFRFIFAGDPGIIKQ